VTLPKEIVDAFKLKAGDELDVTVHPQTGAIVIRPGVRYFDEGKVTRRFEELAERVRERYDAAFDELSK
jgi:bifunctional DNA-binding transcriptional regulator/antitoxin component of YhaV-PrlF toxin-antitoxin module